MERLGANPLLTPADVAATRGDLEVYCTTNPAAVRCGDEVVLLVRVGERPGGAGECVATAVYDPDRDDVNVIRIRRDDPHLADVTPVTFRYRGRVLLTSMSHLRVARSTDGVHFAFDPAPALFPATPYETYGCEDARITPVDGRYLIAYTAVSDKGVTVALASTEDFRRFERHGVIFPPFNKDVCIFPEKVGGWYVCRHRPQASLFNEACIWTAFSPDLLSWGGHAMSHSPRAGTWEARRVGCGAPPLRTDEGWLEIYHGADEQGRYALGALLSDPDRPQRIIGASSRPVLQPEADYERQGVNGGVVFTCGLISDRQGRITVYYGAADTVCAAATTTVGEMIAAARE